MAEKQKLTIRELRREVERLRKECLELAEDRHAAIAEVERLRRERDALLACRHGDQRCHECPDAECGDNTRKAAQAAGENDE